LASIAYIFVAGVPSFSTAATGATVVATSGDASLARDDEAGTWTIAAGGASLTLGLDKSRDFEVLRLASASGASWTLGTLPDTSTVAAGPTLPSGKRAAGFVYEPAPRVAGGRPRGTAPPFTHPKPGLRVPRHYRVRSGSPTFEAW